MSTAQKETEQETTKSYQETPRICRKSQKILKERIIDSSKKQQNLIHKRPEHLKKVKIAKENHGKSSSQSETRRSDQQKVQGMHACTPALAAASRSMVSGRKELSVSATARKCIWSTLESPGNCTLSDALLYTCSVQKSRRK